MLGTEDLVLQVNNLLILAGGLGVLAPPGESKRYVVARSQSIGMLRAQHLLTNGQDGAVLCLRFRWLAAVIKGNSETVASKQGIGVHRTENSFFHCYDGA